MEVEVKDLCVGDYITLFDDTQSLYEIADKKDCTLTLVSFYTKDIEYLHEHASKFDFEPTTILNRHTPKFKFGDKVFICGNQKDSFIVVGINKFYNDYLYRLNNLLSYTKDKLIFLGHRLHPLTKEKTEMEKIIDRLEALETKVKHLSDLLAMKTNQGYDDANTSSKLLGEMYADVMLNGSSSIL